MNTASALLWALGRASERGGAPAALVAAGIDLPEVDRFDETSEDLHNLLGRSCAEMSVRDALAVGVLAGRVVDRRARARRLQDPTSFVMDRELVVQAAEGQSILRLPWFEEGLFVGRQLPDISEMPAAVRRLCIKTYSAALAGERGRFAFTSYGHEYVVDAVPVHGEDGRTDTVLAIATPARGFGSAAAACESTADRLDYSATLAEKRAELHHLAGRSDAEFAERHGARNAREGAERARAHAQRLRSRDAAAPAGPPSITSRQADVLSLASHGLTSAEIAEQLGVSVTTVKTHFDNIYSRLAARDRSEAVATALRHGLID
jgi:DNA-binding CsgD family transcriptional regulator